MSEDFREVNRALWDERAAPHAASPDYHLARFVADRGYLSSVVAFDRERLGDVTGLTGIHLQCHLGTDTLSLARLGARMCGLDFSGESLTRARVLAREAGADIDYRESDVYAAVQAFDGRTFDLVYTGIGAIGWLPDVGRWAQVVADLLAPGGRFFMREGHPVLWAAADPRPDGLLVLGHPYFTPDEPSIWDEPGTYVATDHQFVNTRSMEWNHGLGEVIQALLDAGLRITGLTEHRSVPWVARPGEMVEVSDGEWGMAEHSERLPLTYTVQAVKS